MPDDVVHVRATVRLLPSEESGRSRPVYGGYRPNHNFFGPDNRAMTMGVIDLPAGVALHPGDSIETTIRFLNWPGLEGQIYSGRQWRIQEGARVVGIGTVIEIVRAIQ
ncbi:hypothetical protein LQG66_00715 [Bradyrhizobium ontarionense]|uniref:Translation elongation factor EFTu/EF1A C-terminal domain-containing protein n=1 Tax=Bradyrhizobium ontarionense TaxID=2898149 RepID=A0ABY3RDV8_9BRAD|nr:hypothetical protein [Bradyrhizobium sp. A19]UFZ04878.1 hypothetical protein LQG66_00715 [Bradyrhizobium sp. A19]